MADTPPATALTDQLPATVPAVAVVEARPSASVTAVVTESAPPVPADTAKLTAVLDRGAPVASVTLTVSGANVAPTGSDWLSPLTAAMAAGVLAAATVTGLPETAAVTVHDPGAALAVAVVEATPEELVVASAGEREPPAAVAVPLKVTILPGTAFPNRSATLTASGLAKAAPTSVD